jgi:hypothetical protein
MPVLWPSVLNAERTERLVSEALRMHAAQKHLDLESPYVTTSALSPSVVSALARSKQVKSNA